MEKESNKVVHVEEVDEMPYVNRSIVQLIEEGGMVFKWDGWCFRVRSVDLEIWDVCWECSLRGQCDEKIRKICKAFDFYLGGVYMLELA